MFLAKQLLYFGIVLVTFGQKCNWAKFLSAFGQFEPLPRHFSYLAIFFSKFLYILGYMFDNCVSISGLT